MSATPKAMPATRPQRVWSPPVNRVVVNTPQPCKQQGADNAARRRARRNGWNQ